MTSEILEPTQEEPQSLDPSKPAWASKTYWVNMVMAAIPELHPSIGVWIGAHPQSAILICAAVNVVLRHFTTESVHYGAKK